MIALSLVGALLSAVTGGAAAARVDGAIITVADLAARVAQAPPGTSPDGVLATMIDEALLTAEGRRLKLDHAPAATARFDLLQRQQAGNVLIDREIERSVNPDEQFLRSLFHSTADFAAFDLLTFETQEQAAAAIARIRSGAGFAAQASAAVTSRLAADPANAPMTMRAEISPALADLLFAAAPGTVVGPAKLTEGYAVARLLKKASGTDAEFAARHDALVTYARKQLAAQARGHVVAKLRERAHVRVDEEFLRSMEDLEPTQAQLDHAIATVSGRPLRYRDIFDTVRAIRARGGHMGAGIRIAVAWQAVDARLLQAAAVERGLLNDSAVVALRPSHQAAAVGYAAAVHEMDAAPAPTRDEVRAFYDRNAAAFGRPFRQVEAQADAGARREKREAALARAIEALRNRATISVDRDAITRAAPPRT